MKGSATRSSYFLTRRMNKTFFWTAGKLPRKKSRPRGWGDSQRTGARAYPLFVLAENIWALCEIDKKSALANSFEKCRRRKMKNYKIAVAGTGARDIIGSTKKNHDN